MARAAALTSPIPTRRGRKPAAAKKTRSLSPEPVAKKRVTTRRQAAKAATKKTISSVGKGKGKLSPQISKRAEVRAAGALLSLDQYDDRLTLRDSQDYMTQDPSRGIVRYKTRKQKQPPISIEEPNQEVDEENESIIASLKTKRGRGRRAVAEEEEDEEVQAKASPKRKASPKGKASLKVTVSPKSKIGKGVQRLAKESRQRDGPRAVNVSALERARDAILSSMKPDDVPAVIVQQAAFKEKAQRRRRVEWTPQEVDALRRGYAQHGGSWTKIHNDPHLKFHPSRTQVDLKDKWRNLEHYKEFASRPIREFMIVDSYHNPITSASGNVHVLRNRWPRDAALKAASRSFMYPPGTREIYIYLKEIVPDDGKGPTGPAATRARIVHVYKGSRERVPAADIERFRDFKFMHKAHAEKVREERLLTRVELGLNLPIASFSSSPRKK